MLVYLVRRSLAVIPTAVLVVTIVFVTMRVLPGDPAVVTLGPEASEESIKRVRHQLGLDRPVHEQYWRFWVGIARADLGKSLITQREIRDIIAENLPYTASLAAVGTSLGIAIGLPVGILAAMRRNRWPDYATRVLALTGLSMPDFVLGLLLLLVFAVHLPIFPTFGGGDASGMWSQLWHLTLPAFTMGLIQAAFIMRFTRAAMLEVLGSQYVTTARGKGLREAVVVLKHALRNAMISILTVIGLFLSRTLGGVVLIESVFSRPGMGGVLVAAIVGHDYPVAQSSLLILSMTIVLVNLAVDVLYRVVQPALR